MEDLSGPVTEVNKAEVLFEEGEKHYATNIDEAIRLYTAALAKYPNFAKALNSRGELYLEKKNLDAALEDFNKASELDPLDTDVWINKECVFLQSKEIDKAREFFEKAIQIEPDDSLALYNLGQVYELRNSLDEAIELYGKALSNLEIEQDTEFEIRVSRANLYEKRWSWQHEQGTLKSSGLSDLDLAIVDWTKAIELDPDYTDGYNSRATVQYLNSNFEEARRDYSEAINRAPHIALYCKNRAAALEKLNLPNQAEEDRKRAMELDPNLKFEREVRGKSESLLMGSSDVNNVKQRTQLTTVILTPTLEEMDEEETETDILSESFSRQNFPEDISSKTLLRKLRLTIAKSQQLNRDFEARLEAMRKYYEKHNVKRELMIELVIQKLNSLNSCFKFFISSYLAVSVLDCVLTLCRSGRGFLGEISKKPKHIIHLGIAIIGMGFFFSDNHSSSVIADE